MVQVAMENNQISSCKIYKLLIFLSDVSVPE